ncbi:tRNA glutamyl-Q(34) synthetase GluQRS [Brucella endophytica]|uniref:tRNA glutamyl-Q(34) synthetase GluQRS n=1 Tax=Brucella endophytica TaxID=1963359 RepID=A0A916SEH7_9HYPH|nr:tRNA glutamyl-Q(34) synthetase GluQRS [Brucella endophytica]GGA96260.1 tRNA glutamyl-Q(34) synthetase GluQRS [Brucella endophytica]
MKPVFRFAPSPNGLLHLGHAYSALLNARMAEANGGRFLLRIEDIDTTRCTPELEHQLTSDLRWLGICWEEPVRRQSEHFEDYRQALDTLVEAGLVYPAFMSRGEVRARIEEWTRDGREWPRDPDGAPHYPTDERTMPEAERRRRIAAGEPFAWRLDLDKAMAPYGRNLSWDETGAGPEGETGRIPAHPARWGDVIIARKETPTSYHLSVVVDDALQGVTHVVRGRDLFHATAVHRLLQEILGLPVPLYHHHDLILGDDGRKLSKSRGDTALASLREAGMQPEDIRRMIGL